MKTAHCDFSAYVHIQSLFVCVLCCEWGGGGQGVEGGRDCGGCPWVLRIGGVGCCGKDCEGDCEDG